MIQGFSGLEEEAWGLSSSHWALSVVTMTKNETRFSSITSTSTDSGRSSTTLKPLPAPPAAANASTGSFIAGNSNPRRVHDAQPNRIDDSRKPAPRLESDENSLLLPSLIEAASQSSPTAHLTMSPPSAASNVFILDHRMSDLANYRRELAILDPAGSRTQSSPQTKLATGSLAQIAPWVPSSGGAATVPASTTAMQTTFYNDSSDNLSELLPELPSADFVRSGAAALTQTVGSNEFSDFPYFGDERRPSIASITTTASSTGSKQSGQRGGFKKLQGFFGEEHPGRDSSESSLTHPVGKEHRSHSYTRSHRDRNYSNATDHTREASPSSSRPRTPIPAPEVVPFLYQDSDDIARFGEAPVRGELAGPDKDRYITDVLAPNPPKPSLRSGHSLVLSGHHRHKNSHEDPRALRPLLSRDDSSNSFPSKDRSGMTVMFSSRSRAQSPAPNGNSTYFNAKNSIGFDGQSSPGHLKRGLLNRLRPNRKDKEDNTSQGLRKLPLSTQSLHSKTCSDIYKIDTPSQQAAQVPVWLGPMDFRDAQALRPGGYARATTFKSPFSKKPRAHRLHDEVDEQLGPTDRLDGPGTVYHLDTNLGDMEGIVSRPLPLTPVDIEFLVPWEKQRLSRKQSGINGAWNAPDSWAVRPRDETVVQPPEMVDDVGTPPRPDEKMTAYCIRVFRSDGTFATLQLALDATVQDVVSQIFKKTFVTESMDNYRIVLKRHNMIRVLAANERPLLIQKRLLQQIGYEDRDRLEDIGREDNSYLCRFLFLSARDSDFHSVSHDMGFGRMTKFNHVDLSGRNIPTIPITLYSKASEIISLNLSRNLSLDLPRDFIQSCQNLRDIKFNNNEARRLPPSLSRASKLTYLDISNNRLEQLDHAELNGLSRLLKLNLANNRLSHLPPYFGAYKSLRTLNMSSNFLERFPVFLCELESLIDLDMSFNLISSIPDGIGRLRNLEKFVITNNRLNGELPDQVRNLASLRELDIKYNAISGIDGISQLPKLEILTADHNAISQFSGTFVRIRSLKLSANPITKFEIVQPVPTLKQLNLTACQLASVEESWGNMMSLERLQLDRNYFVSLPGQIGLLRRLENFSIAQNVVGELPPEIGCLTELKVLDIRGNNLRKLPNELWWANKLEYLNASSNLLADFPKPASRPPQLPGESSGTPSASGKNGPSAALSQPPIAEDLNADGSRRPSQASSSLLSVGPSPVLGSAADRKSSLVSVYGKGGRKTSVVSRSTAHTTQGTMTPTSASRKDSGLSQRMTNTFAGSLRHLYLADNQLDDDVFDQITLLSELKVLNLSYNTLSDMPQRSIKSWPQLMELYLSGNDLTSLPVDDLEDWTVLQVLHINGNKFTNLPADISRAKKLYVFDCGSNSLKYNISNVPYDWNWNLNPNLRYLNLSGNRRLEIKQTGATNREQYTDFSRLQNLRVLGLMDVTLTNPSIPDQNEDRRVRTSGSLAGYLPYGMADTLGKNEHLSTVDLVVPRFNSSDTELLLGLFDGQALSSGGSKVAKYLHENFGLIFTNELKSLKTRTHETPEDALRRAFLALNKDLITTASQNSEDRLLTKHRSSASPVVLSKEDCYSGGVATVLYLQGQELYVANVGDVQAMLLQADGHKMLTRKHDPAEPNELSRIRDAGGWVSRTGKLNDLLEVSRAFGYVELMPVVQAAPHVNHWTIGEQDETIIVATRELWEHLPGLLIQDVARVERGDLMRAAQRLRDLAMAYGATNKIMVMMISVVDLKRRTERSRQHRGQSMSWYPAPLDDPLLSTSNRRGKKIKADGPADSTLQRLEAEVDAPIGLISIVFTDIKNSTNLWDVYPSAMRMAIKAHNDVMRRQLRRVGGFEVKTEGDAFMVSFPTATAALLWCFTVQLQLLEVNWPSEILSSIHGQAATDKDSNLIFKGLSVRMGIHWGEPLAEPDPITKRMDYFGPMVNKASRIQAVADGGQIAVSSDFISEIQRCLETYQEASVSAEDGGDEDGFAKRIRSELRQLSSQGFEVKEMGERKLKGLENPEFVYSLYPHALTGRIEQHLAHDRAPESELALPEASNKLVVSSPNQSLVVDPEIIWAIWRVSLRLEMLCSTLEEVGGRGLQPPETDLLERIKQKGAEVTEQFLVNFLEHQVSRIETCVSTLGIRHLAMGLGPICALDELRAPMTAVLDSLAAHLSELRLYKARFGELDELGSATSNGIE